MRGQQVVTSSKHAVQRIVRFIAWLSAIVILFALIGYGLSDQATIRGGTLLISILVASCGVILLVLDAQVVLRQREIGFGLLAAGLSIFAIVALLL